MRSADGPMSYLLNKMLSCPAFAPMHFAGESLNNVLKKRTAMSGATFQDARLEGDFKSKGPKPLIDLVEPAPSHAARDHRRMDKDKLSRLDVKLHGGALGWPEYPLPDRPLVQILVQTLSRTNSRTNILNAIVRFTTMSLEQTTAGWPGNKAVNLQDHENAKRHWHGAGATCFLNGERVFDRLFFP